MKKLVISVLTALILVAVLTMPAVAVEEVSTTASVNVGDVISITLAGGIDFGTVTPPVTRQGTLGQVDGSPSVNITVESETNLIIDIGIKGTLTAGDLALSNWEYSTQFDKSDIAELTTSYVEVYGDKVADDICNFYHWITVPDGTTSGSHTVSVSYKAIAAGGSY